MASKRESLEQSIIEADYRYAKGFFGRRINTNSLRWKVRSIPLYHIRRSS